MKFKPWITAFLLLLGSCSDDRPDEGETSFTSVTPGGGRNDRGGDSAESDTGGSPASTTGGTSTPRAVEETDLYRLEGDRLYFLSAYRGLMVFDVHDVNHPKLLGRSPIFGSPVEMVVRNGIAVIVVADWYGTMEDGTPFHGSVVRGLDATNPTNIKALGEAKLGGWVRDTRVVGDVLYAVSVDYGWVYGWAEGRGGDVATTTNPQGPSVIVSSVRFAGGTITPVSKLDYEGWGGIFNVTANAVLLAHDAEATSTTVPPKRTEVEYLDITDPQGAIRKRGRLTVDGRIQGWGADNGRWNLDFADGKTAHIVACAGSQYWGCDGVGGYVVSTVNFANPDAPALRSELDVAATGWTVTARFDGDRLYLSPQTYDYANTTTPFLVVELGAQPKVAGTARIPGLVWNMLPGPGETMFALGNDWGTSAGDSVTLSYVNVTSATAPKVLGTARFGEGWAWTPASGTFKAFTFDESKGLVVLPFSGWSYNSQSYTNGLQLIEVTATSIKTAGVARTHGWVERGIFVGDRLVALSDVALSVIDFTRHDEPAVVTELTLARNVVAADPHGQNVAELSTDFWDNDVTESEIRLLPIANAEELRDPGAVPTVKVSGTNARVFRNGELAYVVTDIRIQSTCDPMGGGDVTVGGQTCYKRAQQVQVVDLANGAIRLRGQLRLPEDSWSWYWGYGFGGCFAWDWFYGDEVVQVGNSALAFRRWSPFFAEDGMKIDEANSRLYVVDLAKPDAPRMSSLAITTDPNAWWGNMRVVGDTLYTTHYEWLNEGSDGGTSTQVRYYADRIDLSDLGHPRVRNKINVPGLLIGGADDDDSLLYFIDYRWDGNASRNDLAVAKVSGDTATLLSRTTLTGYVGASIVTGRRVYMTAQTWDETDYRTHLRLHALDLGDPRRPVDRASAEREGWGWLLDIEGDRAILTSGWGTSGIDLYKLQDNKAPVFDRFVRTRGWWSSSVSRQGDSLYLASGNWGVQKVNL